MSYNDFSLWDTFRAEHPLLTLVVPERVNDLVKALVQMDMEGGRLPIWPNPTETKIMIASHADCVIADAFVKGLRGYDVEKAYAAVRKDAFVPPPFDTATRWARSRAADGTWGPDPAAGFTEGSPWTYLFGAMHDPRG